MYEGTGAHVIKLDFVKSLAVNLRSKKERKVQWEDWYQFLKSCGAKSGPYLVEHELWKDSEYDYYSEHSAYKKYHYQSNIFASSIKKAIESHFEYRNDNWPSFTLKEKSITYKIDNY